MCTCTPIVYVHVGSVAFISFAKGCDSKSLRTTRIDYKTRRPERSRLVPFALAYQEGHTRPTEAYQQ